MQLQIGDLAADLNRRCEELRRDPGAVVASRARVEAAVEDGAAHYGINTGFGVLKSRRIAPEHWEELQRNLLLSHAVGVGAPMPREISRWMLGLKVSSLGLGYSGISLPVFEALLAWLQHDLVPVVPSQGSVGASGDLAPLAHMALPLLGRGRFWTTDGSGVTPAAEALADVGLGPVPLHAKDALGLINGTQFMSAYGAWVLEHAARLLRSADVLAAMSVEALRGSVVPFDPRLHQVRPHPGAVAVAANLCRLLADSEIQESHRGCDKVQDPYSLRCVPPVHGASRDALAHATEVVEREINSVTDNPVVTADGDILSGGNFHGQPLALALDYAALALAELASISERRTFLLLGGLDGLPTMLLRDTGLHSGLMILQYTAAALVSHNKVLAHPASVDSIPTSLGQEDHVSMGSISATKLLEIFRNTERVLAIELCTAAQALDYRAPLQPGVGVAAAHHAIRQRVQHRECDDLFEDDLEACRQALRSGRLVAVAESRIGTLD